MTQDIDRIPWDINHANGYLLCFDIGYGPDRPGAHADHYLGISEGLSKRLSRHEQGKGAKLTRYARQAGIGWTLTRVWEDIDRNEERRLKGHAGMRWCPRCRTERVMAARDPAYGVAIAAAKAQYQAAVADGRLARDQAAGRSAGTRAWNKAVARAHEDLRAARHEAAAAWISSNPQPGLRTAALACVLDGTPVVTPPMRARQAALNAEAASNAQAWPEGFLPPGVTRPDPGSVTDPGNPWGPPAADPGSEPRPLVTAGPGGPWSLAEPEAG